MQGKDLEHLKIELGDIEFATENFAKSYCIGSGGYGDVYKAVLYLHGKKSSTVHENNKGEFAKIDQNWEAKIADLGLSKLYSLNEESSTINTVHIAGTEVYLDPEYLRTGKLKKATDVYSLGVVMFEILCGRVAYDQIYMAEDVKGLGPIARRRYNEGTLKEMIDPILKPESDEILLTQNEGLNEESLDTFFKIAYKCLAESQAKRPTMEVVIKALEQALRFQENFKENLKFSLEEIKLATEDFSEKNIIGEEAYWKLYRGEIPHANGNNKIKFDYDYTSGPTFDPDFDSTETLTKESDIYSFGVVLTEILCGAFSSHEEYSFKLQKFVSQHFPEGKLAESLLEDIKKQIVPQSLATLQEIVLQCLDDERQKRPTAAHVLMQLKKALEFQEDHEMWEPKLPKDYKELILMSKTPEVYSMAKKEDIYNMFFKGILLGDGKVWFSVGSNGERNEMISARNFTYKNRWSCKWRPVPKSRFHKVAKMLDITNLKIQVKMKPQFLSPGIRYGVHLVFRFCEPKKSLAKRMYVNLKYKRGGETLHAYFATCREDGWMNIELCRFSNHKEDTDFEFLLESFSRCYCESHDIYIEGIEFRAIDNASLKRLVKHEEIKELKETQQLLKSDINVDQVQHLPTNCEKVENYDEGEKFFSLNEVNKKKHYMLSAKEALYRSSNVKLSDSVHSTPSRNIYSVPKKYLITYHTSRFQDVIELQRQQVFYIKCMIGATQSLSPDTDYVCYLVFKISEKCRGLHCPVIVRDLLKRKNKEKGIIYFRSPSPCNVNDTDRVPKEREDGWMEVKVWQFNSNHNLRNDCIHVRLKLVCYEGTMSRLIVSNLEFRAM
ncbi:hypothetical protein L2E82_27981 [Cichorium intybus]|uniref:Uncharacterized protein n=1 Tax=Cichorium intybus TaxID=13427 RepID=A0ACB9CUC7_CICIN|nr:hypothetical protein L2E82_27981 [Cichorium intybus]